MIRKILVSLAILTVAGLSFRFFWWRGSDTAIEPVEVCEDKEEPIAVYGINVDTLAVTVGRIAQNETLSNILDDYGVSYATIHDLANRSRNVFDVRKLRAGDNYVLIHTKGENPKATSFIIEPSEKEFVVYHLNDSVHAERVERKTEMRISEVAGEITSSVYLTALKNGGSPDLVNRLVDVFAWQIDFFRIQKGDKFKVVFQEETVEGKSIGIRRILSAYFEHFGKEYFAIYFDECGMGDYYDDCGNSVRRAFLKAPLDYSRISSRFSMSRFHPVLKRFKSHLGTDYAAPTGTPIRSVGNGVIVEAQYKGGNGNYVKVRHNGTYTTQYLHMSKIASGIRPGVTVVQGQTIGYVGSTGLATGPHLCFRFWKNGQQVDPFKVDLPPAKPVDPTGYEEFAALSEIMLERLNGITIPSVEEKEDTEL
jgi:murein DD-endopeptidase MepM/ murein hydrolase activator NlpD